MEKLDSKYCRLYIVRHGETEWNVEGRVQGHSDSILTENGINQAKARAQHLKDVHFDDAFSSDLIRARHTAEIIALEHNLAVKTKEILREQNFGSYEGKTREETRELFDKWKSLDAKERSTYKPEPQAESHDEVVGRFIQFVREIAITYKGKTILVVTHGGLMRYFLVHLGFATYEELSGGLIRNTAVAIVDTDGIDFIVRDTVGIEVKKA